MLLVTHDVDEALALADRVLVLTSGRISHSCQVSADRPRDRNQPALTRTENAPAHRARRRQGRKDMRNVAKTRRSDARRARPSGPARRRRSLHARPAGCSAQPACSSAGSGSAASSSPAASGTTSANTTSVSNVTLNIGDQAGSGLAGAAHRRRADQQAAVQGALVRLHLRAADASGHGRRARSTSAASATRRRSSPRPAAARSPSSARSRQIRTARRSWCRRTRPSTPWRSSRARASRSPRAARPTTTCWRS